MNDAEVSSLWLSCYLCVESENKLFPYLSLDNPSPWSIILMLREPCTIQFISVSFPHESCSVVYNPHAREPCIIQFIPWLIILMLWEPYIIQFQASFRPNKKSLKSKILQMTFLINIHIFRHLKLEIALAIPALNEWKIKIYTIQLNEG